MSGVVKTELKAQEDQYEVGRDLNGDALTHYVLAERLMQVECASILEDHTIGDHTVIAEMLAGGFRGYHNMSPGELWSQWVEVQKKWFKLLDDDELPWEIFEDDPAAKKG